MAFGDSDLDIFTADFGIPVTFNGVTANGILDQPVKTGLADSGFGGISSPRPMLRVPYNAFSPMPAQGDAITVDGLQYVIADEDSDTDGSFVWYPLKVTI